MLTHRQRETLEFIESEMAATGGIAPTLEEVRIALGLANRSGANRLLVCLEQRGYIRRLHHRARAIEVVKSSDPAARRATPITSRCIPIPVMGRIN